MVLTAIAKRRSKRVQRLGYKAETFWTAFPCKCSHSQSARVASSPCRPWQINPAQAGDCDGEAEATTPEDIALVSCLRTLEGKRSNVEMVSRFSLSLGNYPGKPLAILPCENLKDGEFLIG
jgi:hypothetical protein